MPKTWKQYKKEVCPHCGNQMGSHKVAGERLKGNIYTLDQAGQVRRFEVGGKALVCPKRIKWEAKRKAYAFKNDRVFTIFRMYYDGRKARNLGYGPMTEEECQAHCRDPKTKKAGVYFDGYDSI